MFKFIILINENKPLTNMPLKCQITNYLLLIFITLANIATIFGIYPYIINIYSQLNYNQSLFGIKSIFLLYSYDIGKSLSSIFWKRASNMLGQSNTIILSLILLLIVQIIVIFFSSINIVVFLRCFLGLSSNLSFLGKFALIDFFPAKSQKIMLHLYSFFQNFSAIFMLLIAIYSRDRFFIQIITIGIYLIAIALILFKIKCKLRTHELLGEQENSNNLNPSLSNESPSLKIQNNKQMNKEGEENNIIISFDQGKNKDFSPNNAKKNELTNLKAQNLKWKTNLKINTNSYDESIDNMPNKNISLTKNTGLANNINLNKANKYHLQRSINNINKINVGCLQKIPNQTQIVLRNMNKLNTAKSQIPENTKKINKLALIIIVSYSFLNFSSNSFYLIYFYHITFNFYFQEIITAYASILLQLSIYFFSLSIISLGTNLLLMKYYFKKSQYKLILFTITMFIALSSSIGFYFIMLYKCNEIILITIALLRNLSIINSLTCLNISVLETQNKDIRNQINKHQSFICGIVINALIILQFFLFFYYWEFIQKHNYLIYIPCTIIIIPAYIIGYHGLLNHCS